MGEHQGRKVAVKVLKVYSTSDFNKITSVGHNPKFAKSAYRRADDRCDRADVLQGSHNVEEPLPSECAPAVGGDNGKKGLRNGLRVDGQWEYKRIHRSA